MQTTLLKNIPIFGKLADTDLEAIARRAIVRTFPKNTILIKEGDSPGALFVIESGSVKIFLTDDEGKEVILNIEGPGDYIGELALLDDLPRSASVMTVEKSTFHAISKSDFQRLLREEPEFAINLIRSLTRRIRGLTDEVREFAFGNVYQRVVGRLLKMAIRQSDDTLVVARRLTQQDIANMVGASRETVSRILNGLTRGGYITTRSKQITIHRTPPAA